MIVFLLILSAGLLGVIIYFAFSPKSSRLLRLSAILALGLICASLVVAGIFLIKGPAEEEDDILFPFFNDAAASPAKKGTPVMDIVIVALLLFILILVIYRAVKDHRKADAEKKGVRSVSPIFGSGDELADLETKKPEKEKEEEESFDIEME
jgi:formate-dependent nitrite reductase membrane component NrfD